jgi:hypothetical protein
MPTWPDPGFSRRCGILCAVDEESDEVPLPHDRLVEAFGRASGGRFDPRAIEQTEVPAGDEDADAECIVEFTFAGRRFSFTAKGARDYYDTVSTLKAINSALAEVGIPERFVGVSGDWILGDPGKVREFARKWSLHLHPEREWRPDLDRW